jgi:AsmA protein
MPTPAQLDVHVTADNASIAEIARLASAMGVAFNPGMQAKGQLSADITAKGAATSPALNGSIHAAGLEISGGSVKQPVRVPQIQLALAPTAINSNQFQATTGGTTLNMQFSLQNYTGNSPDVNAKLQTSNAQVGELLSIARAYGVSAVEGIDGTGQLSLNLTASGPIKNTSAMVFSGDGALQNATLHLPTVAKPVNVRNANLRFSQNSMMLDNLNASIDQTNASGNLSVRNFAAPQVQFTLNADKVDLAALQQIVGTAPQQPQPKHASLDLVPRAYARQAPPEPGFLIKASGGGNVSIGQLLYEQMNMQDVKSQVTLDHGVIRLSPLTSTLYGGQQSGTIILDTRVTPPVVSVSSKLQKVDANKLISSTTSLKETIYGLLAANANTNFRAASADEVTRTLSGQLNLDLSNGRIAKIDLLNQLSSIGRFVNPGLAPKTPFTDVTKLTGTFNVVNGLATTNDLRAVIPGANLAANGNINLVSNALNLHLTAVLSKDFSQKVGGTGIGGFMQTALANKNGELVMPILITGTFDRPMFAPDVQQLAQMKLQNLIPSFGNPGNMNSGIVGALLGNKNQQQTNNANQQQQKQQQQQANPLGDLLNQVMQQKKKKQ